MITVDVEELIKDLKSTDRQEHLYALKGIRELGPEAEKALPVLKQIACGKQSPEVKWKSVVAVGIIARNSDNGINILIDLLGNRSRMVFSTAILVLSRLASRSLPALVQALKHDDHFVRSGAAGTLARIAPKKSKRALPSLIQMLKDEEPSARATAAFAIGSIAMPSKKTAQALISVLDDEEWRVRDFAVSALGNIGFVDKDVIDAVIKTFEDEHDQVRYSAISTVAELKPFTPEIRELLFRCLNDSDFVIRASAASILGEMKLDPENALPKLEELLDDEVNDVQEAARQAIKDYENGKE